MKKTPITASLNIYDNFVRDLRFNNEYPFIRYIEDYDNQEVIKLSISQHQGLSSYQQNKLTNDWIKYLSDNVLNVKEMQVCTPLSQKSFEAICNQSNLESLRIKWFRGKDISPITKLRNLKKLFIESAPSIEDISPISSMDNLEVLILGNTKRVFDYSCLKRLKQLKVLGICAYQTSVNSTISMKSDDFLKEMPSLKYIDLSDVRIIESLPAVKST